MLTSANRCRTARSVLEAAVGQPIIDFQDLWLTGRFLPREGEEADLILIQIHFTTNQAMGPDLAERPGLAQQGHLAQAATSPQVDQLAAGPFLQVQLPARRERPAVRGCLPSRRPLFPQGLDVLLGMPLRSLQGGSL